MDRWCQRRMELILREVVKDPPHFKGPEGRHEDVWRKASTRRAFTVLACLNNGVHTRLANMGVWRRVIELGTHLGNRTSVFIEPIAPKE